MDNCFYEDIEIDSTNGFFIGSWNSVILLPDYKCRDGKFIKERNEKTDNKVSKLVEPEVMKVKSKKEKKQKKFEEEINMSADSNQKIKLPKIYKVVAKLVRFVQQEGIDLEQLLYKQKKPSILDIYALALNVLRNRLQLDHLICDTQILIKESQLDPWLARVLISELLWGKKCLQSNSRPVQTVLSYKELLQKESLTITTLGLLDKRRLKKPRYVRVNVLTTTVEKAISSFKDEGWQLLPRCKNYSSYIASLSTLSGSFFVQDINIPELLAFPFGSSFHSYPGYLSGAIILQDKASCLPAFLLNPPPGSVVLDLCAAPGMKTTYLSAMMQNRGKIYAVLQNNKKDNILCQMILAANSYCVKTRNADGLTVDARQCPDVEYILVDPNCSDSGILDRLLVTGGFGKQTPRRLKTLHSAQVKLLRHSLFNFPSVKRVVYSTCSIYPEETEQVVDEVLSDVGDAYKLISVKKLLDGKWMNFSSMDYKCKDNCLYAEPEFDLTNGFFVAVFERNSDVLLPDHKCRKGKFIKGQDRKSRKGKFIKERNEKTDNKVSKLVEPKVMKVKSKKKKKMKEKKQKEFEEFEEEFEEFEEEFEEFEIQILEESTGIEVSEIKTRKKKYRVRAEILGELESNVVFFTLNSEMNF